MKPSSDLYSRKAAWMLAVLVLLMALCTGCSSDGEDESEGRQGQLRIEIDPNCRDEGQVRGWVDGQYPFQLAPGQGVFIGVTGGTHRVNAQNDRGRIWDRTFTVTRYDSTLVLTCD